MIRFATKGTVPPACESIKRILGYLLIVPDITRFAAALVVSKINSNKDGSIVGIGEPAFLEEGISSPVKTDG